MVAALTAAHPEVRCEEVIIRTRGDRFSDRPFAAVGSRGIFARDIEAALLDGAIDLAVHSLKDLETAEQAGLTIGALPARADPRDALVSPAGYRLANLPLGARVGTSSIRRTALLLHHRPDLQVEPIRGNVPTRLQKARELGYTALVLAAAGLDRLDLADAITERLDPADFLPEAGQGAIAVQVRAADQRLRDLVAPLHDPATAACCLAERACAAALAGSCQTPIAAHAQFAGSALRLDALVCSPDGRRLIRRQANGDPAQPEELGRQLAATLLAAGAAAVLRG